MLLFLYSQKSSWITRVFLKPLSQLAPDRFKTLCERKFSNSYVLSLPLHDASHLFYATKWSHQVASEFSKATLHALADSKSVALGLTNSRTTLHNVVLTRNSVARISKVARWVSPLYACVVRPWECCNTCRRWSCNVVLPLHVTCPLV